MSACCARRESQVTRAEADLRRLARQFAAKPHRADHYAPLIEAAKAELARARQARIDHEAEEAA